jgi:2-keto-4-pentenoate hydratase/2-oxohepta-3-ene-1,7-dioic acid hydratase in catechol pathway
MLPLLGTLTFFNMKFICIGRNYVDHIHELNNEIPDEPVVFLKPDTAMLKDNSPFYYPEFSKDIHHEVEVLVKISKEGKFIKEKFAHKYYEEIGLGIDFTARDLQQKAKEKGLPWEKSKAFNNSAVISPFIDKAHFTDIQQLNFHLEVDEVIKQQGNTSLMMHSIDALIEYVSRYFTLKKGDIIFTGTPKGVGPVQQGQRLKGFLENQLMFDFEIK